MRLHFVEILEAADTAEQLSCQHTNDAAACDPTEAGELLPNVHSSFEDVRVNLGHAVDSMRSHDTQMGHVDPLLSTLLDEGHTAQTVTITRELSSNSLQQEQHSSTVFKRF